MKNECGSAAIVVGAGIVGLSCALHLQNAGVETLLVGPDDKDAASWGNAGHLAVEQVEPLASFATIASLPHRLFWRGGAISLLPRDIGSWLPFSLRLAAASKQSRFQAGTAALAGALIGAIPAWRELLDLADARHLLAEDGHFILWDRPESAAAGEARWQAQNIGSTSIRAATAPELEAISNRLNCSPAGGIFFSGSGRILDLPELAKALEARFLALGGRRRATRVLRLGHSEDRTNIHLDTGETLAAGAVVIAAGVASGPLLEAVGHRVPIIAERGYHIQSGATDWPLDLPPIVFEDRSMIVTRFQSGLRAASFFEFSRRDSPPDPRKWHRLRAHAAALGLPFGEPVSEWMGSRPTLPDYLPAIGRSRKTPGLFYAFGHQHLGLTLAAATGKAVQALVAREPPPFDVAPFDLERFR